MRWKHLQPPGRGVAVDRHQRGVAHCPSCLRAKASAIARARPRPPRRARPSGHCMCHLSAVPRVELESSPWSHTGVLGGPRSPGTAHVVAADRADGLLHWSCTPSSLTRAMNDPLRRLPLVVELPVARGIRAGRVQDGLLEESVRRVQRLSPGLALSTWYPRQESNLRTRFRKPLLYPLSYGGLSGLDAGHRF